VRLEQQHRDTSKEPYASGVTPFFLISGNFRLPAPGGGLDWASQGKQPCVPPDRVLTFGCLARKNAQSIILVTP
jgi:hypothetical protein